MLRDEGWMIGIEEAKLNVLRDAADKGWTDIAAGRFTDVTDDQLESFIEQLGAQAAARVNMRK